MKFSRLPEGVIRYTLKLKSYLPVFCYRELSKLAWRFFWKATHFRQPVEIQRLSPTLQGSERAILVERICDHFPFLTLLEVGCAFGQNFHALAPLFPKVEFLGIDRDWEVVLAGQKLLTEKGILNASLVKGEIENLHVFRDKSFDVVIASACLLYISPTAIQNVVKDLVRIARKAVILLEQHQNLAQNRLTDPADDLAFQDNKTPPTTYWVRNYIKLLSLYVPGKCLRITHIPSPLWKMEQWQQLGTIIEAELER